MNKSQSIPHAHWSLEDRVAHIKGMTHLSKDERNRKIDQAYAEDAQRKIKQLHDELNRRTE